jgi:hypothetical protein
MKKVLSAVALVAAIGAAASCYPNRLDSVDYDVVVTVYDTTANFQGATFYLNPTLVHLVPPGESDGIGHGADAAALAAIRNNMTTAGYTETTDSTVADIKMLSAATTTTYQGYYWSYYCGIYYYYCPPYWGSYEFTTGTLIVSMKDRRVAGTGPEAMWLGFGNGLLNSVPSATRVTDAVNAMFRQSPYISAN